VDRSRTPAAGGPARNPTRNEIFCAFSRLTTLERVATTFSEQE
jgi:hypothetical protein